MSRRPHFHPPLVHFPIAFWSGATAIDWLAPQVESLSPYFAWILLLAGMASGLAALLTGFFDSTRIVEGSPAFRTASAHLATMGLTFVLYLAAVLLRFKAPNDPASALVLGLESIAWITLIAGGWLGGRLVYTHGVGQAAPTEASSKQPPRAR